MSTQKEKISKLIDLSGKLQERINKLEKTINETHEIIALIFDKVYLQTNDKYAERLALVLKETKELKNIEIPEYAEDYAENRGRKL